MRICQGYAREGGIDDEEDEEEEGREDALLVPSSRCAPPSPVEGRGCGGGEGPEQAEGEPEEQSRDQKEQCSGI